MLGGCIGVPAEENVKNHVSYSQIQTYLTCPQKYYYHYILEVPVETEPEALVLGRHIHFAVAEFYRYHAKNGTKMPLEQLLGCFRDGWKEEDPSRIAMKNGDTLESVQELAMALLSVYHEKREPVEVASVESGFRVPLIDLETGELLNKDLVGTFDLVEKDSKGNLILVELKTAARAMSDGQVEYSHQPSLYAYALWQLELIPDGQEAQVRYDILTKTKTPKLQVINTSRDKKAVQRSIQLTRDVMRAIELNVFYRNQGWRCADCQFQTVCE